VFVNYTPELGLDKFAPAGRKGEIRVTAYHQEPDRPKIAELKLWISTDDGRLGPAQGEVPRQRRLRSRRPLPEARPDHRLSQPQAEAWDAAGNRVEQTVDAPSGSVRATMTTTTTEPS